VEVIEQHQSSLGNCVLLNMHSVKFSIPCAPPEVGLLMPSSLSLLTHPTPLITLGFASNWRPQVTHMPPELLMEGTLTAAADVYSFGEPLLQASFPGSDGNSLAFFFFFFAQ
jgi:hypothetical protein